jgi:hypothetical protein
MAYLINTGRLEHRKVGKRLILVKRDEVIALREARDTRKNTNQWIEPIARSA